MTFGQLRTSANVVPVLSAGWARLHSAWCAHWTTLQQFTCGVDAPELYTERSFVGQWATAMTAAFPQTGLAIVERPVEKSTPSGRGFLDLWLAIRADGDAFDYAIEAKPLVITNLNAVKAAVTSFDIASAELSALRTLTTTQICKYSTGAALGLVCRHTRYRPWIAAELNSFEDAMWNEVERLLSQSTTVTEAVLATCSFSPGDFSPWKSRVPYGAFGLFLVGDRSAKPG